MKIRAPLFVLSLIVPATAVAQQHEGSSAPPPAAATTPAPTTAATAGTESSAAARASSAPLPSTGATRPLESFTPSLGPPEVFGLRTIAAVPSPIGSAWSPVPVRPMGLFGAPGSGVVFTTGDDFFTVNLRARMQFREGVTVATSATAAPVVTNELVIRTIRLILSGTIMSRSIQYGLQLGLAPADIDASSGSPLYDAWIGFTHLRDLNVRIGQFLLPFDRARANAEWGLEFVDRGNTAIELGLDRDLGIEAGSNNLGGLNLFGYRVGIYSGDGRNRVNPNPGFLYMARVQVNPFGTFDDSVEADIQRLHRPRLSIGGAFAYNQHSDRARSTAGAVFPTVTPPVSFDYLHGEADVTFKWRGLAILGEFLYRRATSDHQTIMMNGMMTDVFSRSAWGYIAQAGFMATDHFEIAARWEQQFALTPDTDPTLLTAIRTGGLNQNATFGHTASFGLNWYQWGHGFKAQSDYSYSFGDDAAHGRHLVRIMLQFSI